MRAFYCGCKDSASVVQISVFLPLTPPVEFRRYPLTESGPVAQLVEQLTFNQRVTGSNPVRLTTFCNCQATRVSVANDAKTISNDMQDYLNPVFVAIWVVSVRMRKPRR